MILTKMNGEYKKVEFLLFDESGNELSYSEEVGYIISMVYYNSKRNTGRTYDERQIDQEIVERNPNKFIQLPDHMFETLKTVKAKVFICEAMNGLRYNIKILHPHRGFKDNDQIFHKLDIIIENYHARINFSSMFGDFSMADYYWLHGSLFDFGYYNLEKIKYRPYQIVNQYYFEKYIKEQDLESFNEDDLLIYLMYVGVCDHVYNGHKIALINYANRVIKNK